MVLSWQEETPMKLVCKNVLADSLAHFQKLFLLSCSKQLKKA